MTVFHKDLTGSDLHVPQGVSPTPLDLADNTASAYRIDVDSSTWFVMTSTTGSEAITLGNLIDGTDISLFGGDIVISGSSTTIGSELIMSGSTAYIDFVTEITDPTSAADTGQLYIKDDAGTSQLFFQDGAGTVHTLTPPGGGGGGLPHSIADNTANVSIIDDGTNDIFQITTTNDAENIIFGTTVAGTSYQFTFNCDSTEDLIMSFSNDAFILGGGTHAALGLQAIGIGHNVDSQGAQDTCVGYNSNATGGRGVCIGGSANCLSLDATAVGHQSRADAIYGVAIGADADAGGTSAIAIGGNADAAHTDSIAMGESATTTATNQFVIGSPQASFTDWYFGEGVTQSAPAGTGITLHSTAATGVSQDGHDFTIAPGAGSSGSGGNFIVEVAEAATLVEVFRCDVDSTHRIIQLGEDGATASRRTKVQFNTGNGVSAFESNFDMQTTGGLDLTFGLGTQAFTQTNGDYVFQGVKYDLDPTGNFTLDLDSGQACEITLTASTGGIFRVKEGSDNYIVADSRPGLEFVTLGVAAVQPTVQMFPSRFRLNSDSAADADAYANQVTGQVSTTDATATTIITITPDDNARGAIFVHAVGNNTTDSDTTSITQMIEWTKSGGTVSSVTSNLVQKLNVATTEAVSGAASGGDLLIQVTGAATKTINWGAHVMSWMDIAN